MEDTTTSEDFETFLGNLLSEGDDSGEWAEVESVLTFENAGLLTMNSGLVVRLDDGSEFQLTVVKSA